MSQIETAIEIFRNHGILRTKDALEKGIFPRTLYDMRDDGLIEQLGRGLFRFAELPSMAHSDLVMVALMAPQAVICLISALDFHDLTTQIPNAIDIAIPRTRAPKLDYPPLNVYRFSGDALKEGVEIHNLDDVPVRIYGPAKSIADAFKFRRKIGLDAALEALKSYRGRPDFDVRQLMHYAHICRVENIMKPYVEALV